MKGRFEALVDRFLSSARKGDLPSLQAAVEESKIKERDVLVNAVSKLGDTALHYASYRGHLAIIIWLLSDSGGRAAGFNRVRTRGPDGWTALHILCQRGYIECVEALVEGSRIDNGEREELMNATDLKGWTALHFAAHHGSSLIVRWLVSDSGGRAAGFKSLLAKAARGVTALHLACGEGYLRSVEALVEGSKVENGEREALINAVDNDGWNALHLASCRGRASSIRWLLSDSGGRAAGFDGLLATAGEEGTALHIACKQWHVACVQALVEGSKVDNDEREALFDAVDCYGRTAFHLAIFYGDASTIQWFLSDSGGRAAGFKSSNITARTKRSKSALHLASQNRSGNVLQPLLSGCTSTERMNLFLCVDVHGWTALHHAARYRQAGAIQELLLHHPETQLIVDRRDHRGMTALHRAVIEGLDKESREEWEMRCLDFPRPTREETIAALLTTPSNGEESQQQAAQIDPNVGLKFD